MYEPGLHDELVARRVGLLRIIVAALCTGVVLFVGVVLFGGLGPQIPAAPLPGVGLPQITAIAIGFLVADVAMALVLPGVMTRIGRKGIAKGTSPMAGASDTEKLLSLYQSQTILGCALLEGAGFLGAVAALLEGHQAGLAVAGIAAGLMVALFFPTQGRVLSWLTTQLDALENDRRGDDFAGGR
jgi:hypothetical protein